MDQLENVSVPSEGSKDEQQDKDFKPISSSHRPIIEDGQLKTISFKTFHLKEEDPWSVEIITEDNTIDENGKKYEIPYNPIQYTNTYSRLEESLKNKSNSERLNQLTESLKQEYQKHLEDFSKPIIIDDHRVDHNLSATFFGNNGSYFAKSESHTQYGAEGLRFTLLVKDTSEKGIPPSYRAYSLSGILALEIRNTLKFTEDQLQLDNNAFGQLHLCEQKIKQSIESGDDSARVLGEEEFSRRAEHLDGSAKGRCNLALTDSSQRENPVIE
jgi:hypothetical protein